MYSGLYLEKNAWICDPRMLTLSISYALCIFDFWGFNHINTGFKLLIIIINLIKRWYLDKKLTIHCAINMSKGKINGHSLTEKVSF